MIDEYARLLELYEYNALTGDLIRRVKLSKRGNVGTIAGGKANAYRFMSIEPGQPSHPVHHVVWFYHHRTWPGATNDLKFKDGDSRNTRIDNLALQSKVDTARNSRVRLNNKSGIKGINWDLGRQCWQVYFYDENGSRALGRAKTLEDAKAKLAAAKALGVETRTYTLDQLERRGLKSAKRKVWKLMLASSKGNHSWASLELLYAEVGDQPAKKYTLDPLDTSRRLGPGNWVWTPPMPTTKTAVGQRVRKLYYKANRTLEEIDARLDKFLRRDFGITVEEYKAKLLGQNGVCANCKQPETATRNGNLRRMAIDHCHVTGKVRGLLCNACNTGVGMLRDDPALLRSMADYIEHWREQHKELPLPENVVSLKDHKRSS